MYPKRLFLFASINRGDRRRTGTVIVIGLINNITGLVIEFNKL